MEATSRAALGAIVGVTLGTPHKGRAVFKAFDGYRPVPSRMASHEALDAWIVAAQHLQNGLSPERYPDARRCHWQGFGPEAAFGHANLERGLRPPMAGSFQNPLSEGGSSLLRCAYWGLVLRGQPESAAAYAYFDAGCDHAGAALQASVALARSLAAWDPTSEHPVQLLSLLQAALGKSHRASGLIKRVLEGVSAGHLPEQSHSAVVQGASTANEMDAVLNLGLIAVALAHSEGDFGKGVCLAAGSGGLAEQNAAVVGAILALRSEFSQDWLQSLAPDYAATLCLRELDPPATLEGFASLIKPITSTATLSKQPVETDSVIGTEWGRIVVRWLTPPIVEAEHSLKCAVRLESLMDCEVHPDLTHDDGWEIAHKMAGVHVGPGVSPEFPVVTRQLEPNAQPPVLTVFDDQFGLGIVPSQAWMMCGPLEFLDEMHFERVHRCEDVLKRDEVFSGRGGAPLRWQPKSLNPVLTEVEPWFMDGPGAVCLWTRVRFPHPGKYRVVAACSPGVYLRWDKRPVLKYLDHHQVIPRAIPPYVGEIEAGTGFHELAVKLFRRLTPVSPLALYFLHPDGRLAQPIFEPDMPC